MHRFYVSPDHWHPPRLVLDRAEAHHCVQVLRMQPGDRVTVFDGRGNEATAAIAGLEKEQVVLDCLHVARTPPLPCAVTLAQAVPKGKSMELIVQKAVELGAAEIVPLLSERTVVQLDPAQAAKKREKWRETAIEACKQCGQNWLPSVHTPLQPSVFLQAPDRFDLMLIASLQSDALPIKRILADHALSNSGQPPHRVLMLVGPEGDFTPAEIARAKSAGCRPVTLGPIILRSETAAIYCLSVLHHELVVHAPTGQ